MFPISVFACLVSLLITFHNHIPQKREKASHLDKAFAVIAGYWLPLANRHYLDSQGVEA